MGNDRTYRVKLFTPNAFIVFRGRKIRTPAECQNVTEKELDVLKLQIHQYSIRYEILNETEVIEEIPEPFVVEKRSKTTVVEELYDPEVETNSIMDQLIEQEKVAKK